MKNFNASFLSARNELESAGIVSLFEVQVSASPLLYQYYAGYNASIDYFKPETASTQTYFPAPIILGEVEQDESKIPTTVLTVGGADQVPQ